MLGLVADLVTPRERTSAPLTVPCHGCGRPVHVAESLPAVVHYHGVECRRRGQERDRRYVDALDQVLAFGVSVLGCLAAIGAVLVVLRALGAVGPEVGHP
jgi:hypothetical protein